VKPGHSLDLRLVAETYWIWTWTTLRELNPELLRLTTPADPQFVLRLPAGTARAFFHGDGRYSAGEVADLAAGIAWKRARRWRASRKKFRHYGRVSGADANHLDDGDRQWSPSIACAPLDAGAKPDYSRLGAGVAAF
jgi:hypothetical protein